MKKPFKKVKYFCRIPNYTTAQTVEFIFSNVGYRATVYSTGLCNIMHLHVKDAKLPLQSTYITPMSHYFATKIFYVM